VNRSAIALTSGGKIIVRGTVTDVGDRLRGVTTDWVEFQQTIWNVAGEGWDLRTIVIHRPQVTCVVEVE